MRAWFKNCVVCVFPVLMLGCGKPSTPGHRVGVVSEYDVGNEDLFRDARYAMPPGAILASLPLNSGHSGMPFLNELTSNGYCVDTGILPNPGVSIYVVTYRIDGMPLDAAFVAAAAKKAGITVCANGKIPKVVGPDKRTPMVLPFVATYMPKKVSLTDCRARMTFPKEADAREALRYFDPSYKIRVNGKQLVIDFRADLTAAGQYSTFEPVADRFGGKVDWVGSAADYKA